jgi:hypothetical protein
MNRILIILILIGTVLFGFKYLNIDVPKLTPRENNESRTTNNYNAPPSKNSYNTPASGSQFSGSGRVSRILSDDNIGSRHQRFIVTLPSNQTILVAHNIDIAPRVPALSIGDTISFNGIYERNSKGGVVHWTHHDPNGRHAAGWLIKNGRKYQ